MLPEYFAVIGAIIASLGGLYYLYETILGTAKPNRVTWLLWAVFPMITFVAQRVQAVEGVSWATFVSGFVPLVIVVASFFNRKAYWRTRPLDYGCMVLGIAGIVLWAVMKTPNVAILFAVLADFAAAVPTLLKAYRHPETESWIAYGISAFGFIVSMSAIQTWNFQNYAFIVYLTVINGLLSLLAVRRHRLENPSSNLG